MQAGADKAEKPRPRIVGDLRGLRHTAHQSGTLGEAA